MGQKIHPLGLRLGITQEHDSKWITRETFTRWRWLMQDKAIRDFLNTNYKEALLEKIIIRRDQTALDKKSLDPINIVRVWIYAENPQALLKFGKSHSLKVISEKLRLVCTNTKLIDSWAKTPEYKILPRIYQIDSSAHKASGIARNLIEKLENRTPFRRALKRTISELQTRERKGVRIQLSGRLNGADIARVEWYKQGRVPLQTLRAQIDYVSKAAKTTHGMLGVKVWTFTGEKGSAF
uniref:Small ribosomal subunit protein uS3c n=1 Tax=Blidingia minima TaxID=63414 RepID=A0A8E5J7D8_9CHLO|nr:30S ribosomal protein S3 [Blidingia minima]